MNGGAAIVGFGAVTPLGATFAETWEQLLNRQSAVQQIHRFDARRYPVTFGAEVAVPGEGPDLYTEMLEMALAEATQGVRIDHVPAERRGVFMGGEAIRPSLSHLAQSLLDENPVSTEVWARHLPSFPAQTLARLVGARGPVATYSTACTSSGQALGEALLAIRRGEVDVAFAGGVDVLVHPLMVTGFSRLGALSTRNDAPQEASRPFDRDRDGFVLGEGCGLVVLVSQRVLSSVGACKGWLAGYGCSANAWRITDSPPDGRGAAQAMNDAMADADVTPEQVVYINAHGTGTAQNDVSEARGIARVLGPFVDKTYVGSTKSMMGHLVAACGVVEAMVALNAVTVGLAPPHFNLDNPDPDCALRHVQDTPTPLSVGVAMSNTFGFGGSNASLVLVAAS